MTQDMRGLFSIVKGQYKKNVGECFTNEVTSNTMYLGGYDPYEKDTEEWYQVFDNVNYKCICCCGDYDKVLKSVYNTIKHHRGVAKNYFKHTKNTPGTSPIMRSLYEHTVKEFGVYFSGDIEKMEDLAYEELAEDTPIKRARKLVKKRTKVEVFNTLEKEEKVLENMTPKTLGKTKIRRGIKKLPMCDIEE